MLIGVIGKSGSGKSSLVRRMKSFDDSIIHVDIDKIGHDILKDEEIVENIVKIVEDDSVVVNGVLDRKKVGNIVFNDLEKYNKYYKYTEDIENAIIDKIIEDNKDKKVVLDWIILDQTKYWKKLDYKILVETDYDIRKERVIKRDNISEEYFDLREVMKKDYNKEEMNVVLKGNNISDIVSMYCFNNDTDIKKFCVLHKWMLDNIVYINEDVEEHLEYYGVVDAFVHKKAGRLSYARVFQLLLLAAGIKAELVYSSSVTD